jgi:hypothetical protein
MKCDINSTSSESIPQKDTYTEVFRIWNRIRIGSALDGRLYPDPGCLKRYKMKEKNDKRQIIWQKSIKSKVIGIQMV